MSRQLGLFRRVEHLRLVAIGAGHELAIGPDPELSATAISRPRRVVRHLGRSCRIQGTVPPHDLHLRASSLRRERVGDTRARRCRFLKERGRFGLDARGKAEIEGPVRRIHDVTRHVAERPGAEIPEPAPLERHVRGVIRSLRSGAEPQVPVERGRNVILLERPFDRLRPDRPVGPEVHLPHRTDRARLHPFANLPGALAGMALVAHLGHELGMTPGVIGQRAHFPHGPRERLLDVGVLSRLQSEQSGRGVRVVGRRDGDRVDAVPLFVEHLAVIPVALGLGICLERVFGGLRVHVAEGVDVLALHPFHIVAAHAAHVDARHVERVARRPNSPTEHGPRNDRKEPGGAEVADEPASRDAFASHG